MSNPRLSVLVPTYNYADYLEACLASVLDQAAAEVEIVVVDDGSTDGTRELLEPLARQGRIRYYLQENQGVSAARNHAMRQSRADLLMFLDADDSLRPGCVAATLDFMSRHSEVGFFFTNYDIFDVGGVVHESGVDTWKIFRTIPHRVVADGEWIFTESLASWILRYGGFMHTSGVTLRRSVAERTGSFRVGYSYGEDDDFYARATSNCTAGYLDRVLTRKRNHARSLIHDKGNRVRNALHMLELTELQFNEAESESPLRSHLDSKLRRCVENYAHLLLTEQMEPRAREVLARYALRYPAHAPFYRLWLKSLRSQITGR